VPGPRARARPHRAAHPEDHLGGLAFPHATQAIQIVRRRTVKGKRSAETYCAVTSLRVTQAKPAQLAAIIRGHWGTEDRLHWVRDMDFDEGRAQVGTASGPRLMASLRNLVITILRLPGPSASPPPCATTPGSPAAPFGRS
jgi:predicted transposase YbfD/YdcC